jgi:hypothetical protein
LSLTPCRRRDGRVDDAVNREPDAKIRKPAKRLVLFFSQLIDFIGEPCWVRTNDLLIKRPYES